MLPEAPIPFNTFLEKVESEKNLENEINYFNNAISSLDVIDDLSNFDDKIKIKKSDKEVVNPEIDTTLDELSSEKS